MGLENMLSLNKILGNPLRDIPIVHVTGTNGKGSCSLKIARALSANGIRTGLFVSPHISSFKERIQINGEYLEDSDVEKYLPQIFNICQNSNIHATFFEVTTALAFMKFAESKCEAIVLEVGLGGRLDATNIVIPKLSIITSVQLDHVKILGDTLEKIALEKAGIIKPNINVLVGPGCPIEILKQYALANGAPFYQVKDVLQESERLFHSADPLNDTEHLNIDISRAALRLLKNTPGIFEAIEFNDKLENALKIRPPCRFEEFSITNGKEDIRTKIILDIAHNEEAIKALIRRLKKHYPTSSIRFVLGMSSDKDVQNCLNHLNEFLHGDVSRIYCTAAEHVRAIPTKELRRLLLKISPTDFEFSNHDGEINLALHNAIRDSISEFNSNTDITNLSFEPVSNVELTSPTTNLVVVCGTAFIMSEVRAKIGILEPRDSEAFSAGSNDYKRDTQEVFPSTK